MKPYIYTQEICNGKYKWDSMLVESWPKYHVVSISVFPKQKREVYIVVALPKK